MLSPVEIQIQGEESMQRRSLTEITELLAEQASSGESAGVFCRSRGISEQTFSSWRKRAQKSEQGFVQVSPVRRVELELTSGVRFRVRLDDLKAILSVL